MTKENYTASLEEMDAFSASLADHPEFILALHNLRASLEAVDDAYTQNHLFRGVKRYARKNGINLNIDAFGDFLEGRDLW